MSSVYSINKGINRPLVFKGLKAQYIWYLAGGLMILMIIFAILYIFEVNTFISLGMILILGSFLRGYVYRLSHTYGQFGLMKKLAKRSIPRVIKTYSRKEYVNLKK